MNILLLAAGKGERFTKEGYSVKPLIEVDGKPMWKFVLHNFLEQFFWTDKTNVYVVTKKEYGINNQTEPYTILNLVGPQLGAAWSAREAMYESACDVDKPLIILNCDQVIKYDGKEFWQKVSKLDSDGALFHFHEPNGEDKWGRSVLNDYDHDKINKIVEKTPISEWAHTGHYYWKRTSDFYKYARKMFSIDMKVNKEFFISPIYNLMIEDGLSVDSFFVDEFHGIGIPEDLEKFKSD